MRLSWNADDEVANPGRLNHRPDAEDVASAWVDCDLGLGPAALHELVQHLHSMRSATIINTTARLAHLSRNTIRVSAIEVPAVCADALRAKK